MKKKFSLFLLIFFTISFCFGCQNVDKSADDIKLKDSVLIFRMNENTWEKNDKNPILEITDEEGVELFKKLINNATKVIGLLDMKPPSYIAEITSSKNNGVNNGTKTETIIFELDAVGGLYCKKDDTHTWYTFNTNDVSNFIKYLDKINKNI